MTTEEKARAYDEAVKKAREIAANPNRILQLDDFEELFPGISDESEDEKAIKLIRSLLENVRNVQSNTSLYKQYDDALAWLEKQKKSLHIPETCKENSDSFTHVPENGETGTRNEQEPVEESIRTKIISRAKSEKQVVLISETNDNAEIGWDTRSLRDTKNLLEYGLAFINEQLEQKPVECSKPKINGNPIPTENQAVDISPVEWSEEDWKLLDEVREHIIGVIGDKPDLTPNKIYDGFLDLIDRLKFAKPQLKQEWSKEDKDIIDEAAELALGWGCPNLSVKLKSILSRVKPAEWSEKDEKLLDFWLDVIDRNDWRMDENFCKASREFINRLKSLRPQPKQEWTEEDEDCLKRAIWYVENPAPSVVRDTNLALWLQSLPQRFNLQPKQEWSEEDRKNIERLIEILPKCIFRHPSILERDECRDLGVWLRNLLYYPQKLEGWKPSEEQMEALKAAMEHKVCYCGCNHGALRSLYKDLNAIKSKLDKKL